MNAKNIISSFKENRKYKETGSYQQKESTEISGTHRKKAWRI